MLVEELLSSKGIEFRPSGKDCVIRCLNPDHEDKNPSLRVDKNTGIFNCLSCGFSGNLFNFFGEKADYLDIRRRRLKDIITNKLVSTSGLSIPTNAIFWDAPWRGISVNTLRNFEAFQHNNSEFIGRIVFPIRDITNKIVAFCGRHTANGTPKYLMHPPSASLPLFPIVKPIRGRIILVEGLVDMLNLHDKGLTNAVCAFGVNKLDEEKINILKIQGVSEVDIFYDMDEAGQAGAAKAEALLEKHDLSTNIITYEDINDPGELTAQQVIRLKEGLYG